MEPITWWAKGLLFENCSCQLLCPAHISFKQTCENDRCRGHWIIHIADGGFGNVGLGGLTVVVLYDTPVRMFEGGWIQAVYIDDQASAAQRDALEAIFSGKVGGPWAILGQFVATRLESQFVSIQFADDTHEKRLTIPGVLETTVTAVRGRDDKGQAVLSNLYNVLHGAVHVLARGRTRCSDRVFDFANERTHALWSDFSWEGSTGVEDGPFRASRTAARRTQ